MYQTLFWCLCDLTDAMGFLLFLCVTCRRWARCFRRGTPYECFSLLADTKEITVTSCFTFLWQCFRCLNFRERGGSVYCIMVVIDTGQIQSSCLSFHLRGSALVWKIFFFLLPSSYSLSSVSVLQCSSGANKVNCTSGFEGWWRPWSYIYSSEIRSTAACH